MNLVTVKQKFQVTIPAKLRRGINLQVGDVMEAIRVDDGFCSKSNKWLIGTKLLMELHQRLQKWMYHLRIWDDPRTRLWKTQLRKSLHHAVSVVTTEYEGSI